jgi:hypothetical protein
MKQATYFLVLVLTPLEKHLQFQLRRISQQIHKEQFSSSNHQKRVQHSKWTDD